MIYPYLMNLVVKLIQESICLDNPGIAKRQRKYKQVFKTFENKKVQFKDDLRTKCLICSEHLTVWASLWELS